ncbi:PadR family transcriptional regulator [Leifsonia shinshuensis]|uniref:PadR family transcriptional regulator n=1 Tax=Leifsonia shinshuensis TaxID=150026 RepID=UPI001F50BC9C|nr:PadR family transcriptional regulator [Leifsonia shinshuensis]MCI0157313.1 PadR family transcriptional regulator [Leifsonia shinshuensis]
MTPAVFAHGSLRLYLLSLLAEEPRHGYELIQALSDRFGGTYVPSAGTIYPRLAKLEEEGLVTKTTDGRKTVYSITDAGRAELASREHELDAIEEEVTDSVRRLADEVRAGVNDAMRTLRAELASAAREAKRDATRVDPRQEARDAGRDARAAANAAAREAEVAINDFRQQLRTDLRSQAARGSLPANVVPLLKEELTRVRRTIAEAIARS